MKDKRQVDLSVIAQRWVYKALLHLLRRQRTGSSKHRERNMGDGKQRTVKSILDALMGGMRLKKALIW